jgi:hypothetical protein
MGKLFEELLLYVIRVIVFDLVSAAVLRFVAWIVMQVRGRWPKIIVLVVLGIGAYFAVPIIMGLIGF